MTTDVAVPVSELAGAIEQARRALDESGLRGGIVGHVGDGNFHVAFLLDPDDAASIEQAEALNTRVVEDALARGGTCTGEHGIGYGKLAYLDARARRPAAADARHQGAARPERDHESRQGHSLALAPDAPRRAAPMRSARSNRWRRLAARSASTSSSSA